MIAVGLLAVGAVGATNASALPELLWCMESVGAGLYETMAKCDKLEGAATGLNWEWEDQVLSGEKVELMFTSNAGLMITASGGTHIECSKDTGSITEIKLVGAVQIFSKGTVTFTGCKELTFGSECNSPGQPAGTIVASELEGELVYLKSGKKTPVGVLLQHAGGTGSFTKIECLSGIISETVTGSVIGEITSPTVSESPANTGTLVFAESGGKQQWTKVEEGSAVFQLTAFGEPSILVTTETLELLVEGAQLPFEIDF